MKEKKLRKKLSLNKATIANLSLTTDEMMNAYGGSGAYCTTLVYLSIMFSCAETSCPRCWPDPE
jgi:hypothetical protein